VNALEMVGAAAVAFVVAAGAGYTAERVSTRQRRRRRRPPVVMARPLTSYERWAKAHPGGWWGPWRGP
jgi:hypothetical protein